eukprot:Lankesteria_metandrocarpae@DN7490_c0_g1_i1.p1
MKWFAFPLHPTELVCRSVGDRLCASSATANASHAVDVDSLLKVLCLPAELPSMLQEDNFTSLFTLVWDFQSLSFQQQAVLVQFLCQAVDLLATVGRHPPSTAVAISSRLRSAAGRSEQEIGDASLLYKSPQLRQQRASVSMRYDDGTDYDDDNHDQLYHSAKRTDSCRVELDESAEVHSPVGMGGSKIDTVDGDASPGPQHLSDVKEAAVVADFASATWRLAGSTVKSDFIVKHAIRHITAVIVFFLSWVAKQCLQE